MKNKKWACRPVKKGCYGIIARVSALGLLAALFCGAVYPEGASGPLADFAGIMAQTDKLSVSRMLSSLNGETGVDVRVVIIRALGDFEAADMGIEEYAAGLFNGWMVGGQSRHGALLLISVSERQVAVEAGGLDEKFYDKVMKEVIQPKMVPHFKEDDFGRGIYEGVRALRKVVPGRGKSTVPWALPAALAALLLAAAAVFAAVRSKKPGAIKPRQAQPAGAAATSLDWGGGSSGGW